VDFVWILKAQEGPIEGHQTELNEDQSIVLGRESDCDLPILDASVSKKHVRVTLTGASVTVEDLDSSNGVHVDGLRISEPTELRVGSRLTVGFQVFVLELAQSETGWEQDLKRRIVDWIALPTHPKTRVRYPSILLEAFLFTGAALFIVGRLGMEGSGFFGLFLAAASLIGRFDAILESNRRMILVSKVASVRANLITAIEVMMLFMGMCCAFFVLSTQQSPLALRESFGFIHDMANLSDGDLLSRNFSNIQGILTHNAKVAVAIVILCTVYRTYAALLTLGWNAAVWVITLVTLTRRILEQGDLNNAKVAALSFCAVSPHLILEGAAYILIAVAAILYSRGLTKYAVTLHAPVPQSTASFAAIKRPQEDVLSEITTSTFRIFLLGLIVLFFAALVESFYAPWMLETVAANLG
jgi:hypothetical protein